MIFISERNYSTVTPEIAELARGCSCRGAIDPDLYVKLDVKRGLRDLSGKGVLAGLTEVSDIIAYEKDANGIDQPCEGVLRYRGFEIRDLVDGFISENRFGFEEIVYLLLFSKLPAPDELASFTLDAGRLPDAADELCAGYNIEGAKP